MAQSLVDFDQFDEPTVKERGAEARVSSTEAASEKTRALLPAQMRQAEAAADIAEAKARGLKEKTEAAEAAEAESAARASGDIQNYLTQIQSVRDLIGGGRATGLYGQITGGIFASEAADLDAQLEALKSPIVLKALQDARKGSAAGATGFGALVNRELNLLASKLGTLDVKAKPETLLRTLNAIEEQYRRAMAAVAGYDPDSTEGAVLAGLAPPEGLEPKPPADAIGAAGGRWVEDPELRGVNAAVISMVKAGRSAPQIRQWLNTYREGLGDKVTGLEAQIDYHRKTGKDPEGNIGYEWVPGEETLLSKIGDSSAGAAVVAAADQLASGLLSEAAAGELEGADYEQRAAVQRGLREKYPTATAIGDTAGMLASSLGGAYAGLRHGFRLPGLLEGVGQETLYGFGTGEPGDRLENALYNAVSAPVTNIVVKPVADIAGNILRGADPERAALAQNYGIELTPGQLTGREATEETLGGLPFVGPSVTARRNDTLTQFNQAAFDEALAPLGMRVDSIGQRGIADAQNAVETAYMQALGGVTLQLDPDFMRVVRGKPYAELQNMKGELGPKAANEIDHILNTINNNGLVSGEAWQRARRELVDLQNSQELKNDITGNTVRGNLNDIIDGFDDLIQRQVPDAFETYASANASYRNLKILERAVDYAPEGDIFGPNNLRAATRSGTQKFGGKSASARGDRPFNDLVQASLGVVPKKADQTSLAGRIVSPVAGSTAAGTAAATNMFANPNADEEQDKGYLPPWLLAMGAGAGLLTLPYSRRVNRAMGDVMSMPRPEGARTLGDLVQTYAPAIGRGFTREREPRAPSAPEDFDYSKISSPEFKQIAELAASNMAAMPQGGPMIDVDVSGNVVPEVTPEGGITMGGRPVEVDPVNGVMIYVDTGEVVEGYKRGGAVKGYKRGGPTLRDRARSVGQGVAFGFGDEIEGGARALGRAIGEGDLMNLRRKYLQERDMIRAQQKAYEDAHPIESLLYEGGGAMLTGLIPGAQGATAARMAQLAARSPKLARAAGVAADTALYGAGTAESIRDIPRSIRDEAIFAVPMYGAAEGIRSGVSRYRVRKGKKK
jgi:hypothetical protein